MQAELDEMMADIQRSRFREQRAEMRDHFVRPVSVHLEENRPLTTLSRNISRQGILILARREFAVGMLATLRIHSRERQQPCFRCEVRWCDDYGDGWFMVGWKFLAVTSIPRD